MRKCVLSFYNIFNRTLTGSRAARYGKNVFTQPAPIDLSAAHAFSLDLDLDDEAGLARERRAMGGDVEAQLGTRSSGTGVKSNGRDSRGDTLLIDSDDDS